jgi:hypothetical protein
MNAAIHPLPNSIADCCDNAPALDAEARVEVDGAESVNNLTGPEEFVTNIFEPTGSKVGIEEDLQGTNIMVSSINTEGLVADWNAENPVESVHIGDIISKVNGRQQNILNELHRADGDLSVHLKRGEPKAPSPLLPNQALERQAVRKRQPLEVKSGTPGAKDVYTQPLVLGSSAVSLSPGRMPSPEPSKQRRRFSFPLAVWDLPFVSLLPALASEEFQRAPSNEPTVPMEARPADKSADGLEALEAPPPMPPSPSAGAPAREASLCPDSQAKPGGRRSNASLEELQERLRHRTREHAS